MFELTSSRIDQGGIGGPPADDHGCRFPSGLQNTQWGFLYFTVVSASTWNAIEYEEHNSLITDITGSWFEAHCVSGSTQDFWRCFSSGNGSYFHAQLLSFTNVLTALMSPPSHEPPLHSMLRPQKVKFPSPLHLAQAMLRYVIFCVQSKTGSSFCSVIFNCLTVWQSFGSWLPGKLQEDFMITPDHESGLVSPHFAPCRCSSSLALPFWSHLRINDK